MKMRNATCVGTQTSKVPTRVIFLFITILWSKVGQLKFALVVGSKTKSTDVFNVTLG